MDSMRRWLGTLRELGSTSWPSEHYDAWKSSSSMLCELWDVSTNVSHLIVQWSGQSRFKIIGMLCKSSSFPNIFELELIHMISQVRLRMFLYTRFVPIQCPITPSFELARQIAFIKTTICYQLISIQLIQQKEDSLKHDPRSGCHGSKLLDRLLDLRRLIFPRFQHLWNHCHSTHIEEGSRCKR